MSEQLSEKQRLYQRFVVALAVSFPGSRDPPMEGDQWGALSLRSPTSVLHRWRRQTKEVVGDAYVPEVSMSSERSRGMRKFEEE